MPPPANTSCQGPELSPGDISEAYSLIQSALHKTPILTSKSINSLTTRHGRDQDQAQAEALSLFFKAEVFQKTGAFKFRGASHAIARLAPSALKKGVVTHSSGNHSAALACAAKEHGIKCHVVMVRPQDFKGG
jgi:threonine dehydratase